MSPQESDSKTSPDWVRPARRWAVALLVPALIYLIACVLFLTDNPGSAVCQQGDAFTSTAHWQWIPLGLECRPSYDDTGDFTLAQSAFPRGQWLFNWLLFTSLFLLASTALAGRRRTDIG